MVDLARQLNEIIQHIQDDTTIVECRQDQNEFVLVCSTRP